MCIGLSRRVRGLSSLHRIMPFLMITHLLRDETNQIMEHLIALVVLLTSCYHRREASSSLGWWNTYLYGGNHFIRFNGRFPRILSRIQVNWKQAMSCKSNNDNTALHLVCCSYIKGSILRDLVFITPNNLHVFIFSILELTIYPWTRVTAMISYILKLYFLKIDVAHLIYYAYNSKVHTTWNKDPLKQFTS